MFIFEDVAKNVAQVSDKTRSRLQTSSWSALFFLGLGVSCASVVLYAFEFYQARSCRCRAHPVYSESSQSILEKVMITRLFFARSKDNFPRVPRAVSCCNGLLRVYYCDLIFTRYVMVCLSGSS